MHLLFSDAYSTFQLQAARQFSSHLDFNLFRSFRSQKSQSSSEGKSNKLPGITEQDADSAAHTSDVTSDSVATETEEVLPTAPVRETTLLKEEANATQNVSPVSSRRSDMDYVILDPDADQPCKCLFVCMSVSIVTVQGS